MVGVGTQIRKTNTKGLHKHASSRWEEWPLRSFVCQILTNHPMMPHHFHGSIIPGLPVKTAPKKSSLAVLFNILLIEDNDEDARQVERKLRNSDLRPYQLQRAASLQSGIEILRESADINIILLDLYLGDSEGMETFHALHRQFPNLPIIVLTGLMDNKMGMLAVESGAQNFLEKTHLTSHLIDSSVRFAIARNKKFKRMEQAISTARIATWELDPSSNSMKWSPAIHELLLTDPHENPLNSLTDFLHWVHPEDLDEVDGAIMKVIGTGEPQTRFIKLVNREHYQVFVNLKVEVEFNPFEGSQIVVGLIQDMTDHEKMKSLIQEKELANRSAKIRQDFLARTSHEIRTPLNPILVMTKLLRESTLSQQQREYIEAINTAGKTLLAVVNDILDLSKIEAGKIEFSHEPFSLANTLDQIEEMMASTASEKGLSFLMNLDPALSQPVMGDSVRLSQILLNLLSNGIKFTQQGHVGMYVKQVGRKDDRIKVQFTVFDSGIGIPEANINSVFESFQQVNNSESLRQVGTGLGLTIVKNLVQLQGGEIEVESEVNVGSKFTVTLEYDLAFEQESVGGINVERKELVGKRVLMAEDNPLNQLVTKKLLTDWGVELEIANHGKEAIEKLQQNQYDVILMDLQMPVMDGLEATRVIRKHFPDTKSRIPIIALTANAFTGVDDECFQAGMTDYVSKPIEITTLYHKLVRYSGSNSLTGDSHQPTTSAGDEQEVDSAPTFEPMAKITQIDLSYLREVANGDTSIMRMAIEKYLETTPAYLENMQIQLRSLNYDGLRKAAHKLKSSLQFMGLDDLYHLALMVETSCKAEQNMEQLPVWVGQISEGIDDSYVLLKESLASL